PLGLAFAERGLEPPWPAPSGGLSPRGLRRAGLQPAWPASRLTSTLLTVAGIFPRPIMTAEPELAPRTSRTSQVAPGTRGLVIQTAFPGDVILSTPLIRRAAERLGVPVDVLVIPAGASVLKNNPHIRDMIVFDKQGKD